MELLTLGERRKWSTFFKSVSSYTVSAVFAGGIIGFVSTLFIFLLTFWVPNQIKELVILVIFSLLLLHELKIIKLKLPQNQWQIPSSWLIYKSQKNMIIWGVILGAGIFTYIPNVSFYLLYIYLGFFYLPNEAILFGMLYGFSRVLPSIIYVLWKTNLRNDLNDLHIIWRLKKVSKFCNVAVCILFVSFIIL